MDNKEKKVAFKFEVAGNVIDKTADAQKAKESIRENPQDKSREIKEANSASDRTKNERFAHDSLVEEPSRIRTTYVPKFTEASDNFRRSYNTIPRAVKVENNPKQTVGRDKVDPTAEMDDTRAVNRVMVTSTPTTSREFADETVKMYKFNAERAFASQTQPQPQPQPMAQSRPVVQPQQPQTQVRVAPMVPESDQRAEAIPVRETSAQVPPTNTYRVAEEAPVVRNDESVATARPAYTYTPPTEPAMKSAPEISASEGPLVSDGDLKGGLKKTSSEFASQAQRDAIKDKFLDSLMAVRVRLIAAIFIGLAIFAFECVGFIGNSFMEQIRDLPYGEAVIEMLFATALFALAMPEIVRAVRYLFHYVACPELSLPVSYAVLVGYTLVVTFSNTASERYLGFGSLFAIQVIAAMFASYFRLSSEFDSFKIASRNVIKCVLDKRYTRTLPRENMALDGAIDEYTSKIARVYRTAFVSDFFRRASKVRENSINVIMMLGISLAISLITGIIGFFLTESASAFMVGYEIFCLVFLLAIPTFSVLVHKLPLKKVVSAAGKENSTFVGESSIYDGADVDVIAYEDTEIFGEEDVSIRKLHMYGKAYNTGKAMRQMYALFSAVGGPLVKVFAASLDRKCAAAENVVIENDGIIGTFEGHKILAGTEEFMLRHHIAIPADDYKTKLFSTDSTKVMYGAEDGEVYVKFFLRYSFSEEFTMLIPEFKSRKIVPLIYTRDPNLTGDLLRVLTLGDDVIRVMRVYQLPTENKLYRRISSGIITLGDEPNSINMLLLARRYTSLQSALSVSELVAMLTGGILGAVLALLYMNDFTKVPSFALAGWQIVWCIYLSMRSGRAFKFKNKDK